VVVEGAAVADSYFGPFIQNLNIASGSVAPTPTQIAAGVANVAKKLNLTFNNIGGNTETITLTISLNGATARRVAQVMLDPGERWEVCGFPVNLTDVIYAQTTDAGSVDYLVSLAGENQPQTMTTFDNAGRVKTAPYILEQMDAITG